MGSAKVKKGSRSLVRQVSSFWSLVVLVTV